MMMSMNSRGNLIQNREQISFNDNIAQTGSSRFIYKNLTALGLKNKRIIM